MQPLVSVGIPTYNRPEGLKKALKRITEQNYQSLEIIVSNNASTDLQVDVVMNDFLAKDKRIRYFKQPINKGPAFNFDFVLEKATGEYFIWAADDDQWEGADFLEKLLIHAPSNVLVFPDAVLSSNNGKFEYPLKAYEKCIERLDYTRIFCTDGVGHPVYGLYNLQLFNNLGLEFKFDEDLSYYNEGTFLHKLFLNGPVKYVKEAKILFSASIAKSPIETQLNDFFTYFERVILIYALSDLANEIKTDLINEIFRKYETHIKELMAAILRNNEQRKISFSHRLKSAVKVLLQGRL